MTALGFTGTKSEPEEVEKTLLYDAALRFIPFENIILPSLSLSDGVEICLVFFKIK